jgi:D-alanine transaminase
MQAALCPAAALRLQRRNRCRRAQSSILNPQSSIRHPTMPSLGDLASSTCYLNGQYLPLGDAKISVLDRGFIFGDGIYEVVPVYYRKPFRLEQHLARFERSTGEIGLASPLDRAGWRALIARLIASSPAEHQFIYWQVTRGVAKRDFSFPADAEPTVFAMTTPFTRPGPAQRDGGLTAVTRGDERWMRCDIKSVSLLGAVLARQFATEQGADEVVQFRDGQLTEGAASNMWVVKDGTLLAPPKSHLILEGIRYGFMQDLAEQAGIPFQVRPISKAEVHAADELMLTAATREVLPIVTLDGAAVGTGRPGPIYARIRAGYDAAIEALRS